MIEITNRFTGGILYSSATAHTVVDAVIHAAKAGANIAEADLTIATAVPADAVLTGD